jgi:hypothetical protein
MSLTAPAGAANATCASISARVCCTENLCG